MLVVILVKYLFISCLIFSNDVCSGVLILEFKVVIGVDILLLVCDSKENLLFNFDEYKDL